MGEFVHPFETIFREAFEARAEGNDYTWFVEGSEGFFQAIDDVSAAEASLRLTPEMSSIAAHTDHTRYYIRQANLMMRGQPEPADWEGSWKRQSVTDKEWESVRQGLRGEVSALLEWVRQHGEDNPDHYLGGLAMVAHSAFHLGAVRQLYRWVKTRSADVPA